MLTSCLALGTTALAAVKGSEPTVTIGADFDIAVPHTDDDKINSTLADLETANVFFAKFIPEETEYYEFRFAKDFDGKGSEALVSGIYSYENNELVNKALCREITHENESYANMMLIRANPTVSGRLEAGKEYALIVITTKSDGFNSSVKVQRHTHSTYSITTKGYVDSVNFADNRAGSVCEYCYGDRCDYENEIATFFKVTDLWLSKTKYVYNGKAKKPTVYVRDINGNYLKKGTDYTVSYSKNKKVGTGYAKVTFCGNYEGSFTKTFKINPKATAFTSTQSYKNGFTLGWKKQTKQVDGYQLQCCTNKKFKKGKKQTLKKVTVTKNKTAKKTIGGLKKNKKYYVRIRTYKKVNGKKYYSKWSETKTLKTKK